MKFQGYLFIGLALFTLSGCGGRTVVDYWATQQTTPGAQLPTNAAIVVCNQRDQYGRCAEWSSRGQYCVNPKGGTVEPRFLPCPKNAQGEPIPFPPIP